ncbi:serine/threonine protein kinase, partial [Streptomyces sp. NPDC054838]
LKYTQDSDGGGGSDKNASAPDGQQDDDNDAVAPPAGWKKVVDPAGFSLFVPADWSRRMDGDQIDYTPDGGRHFIRIAVDKSPDWPNPYTHLLDLEKQLRERTDYKRHDLHGNTFRGTTRAALWDFSWTEKGAQAGPRRAVEQMYVTPDEVEYAVYMSGPAADWTTTRQQFDTVLSGWQPAAKAG